MRAQTFAPNAVRNYAHIIAQYELWFMRVLCPRANGIR